MKSSDSRFIIQGITAREYYALFINKQEFDQFFEENPNSLVNTVVEGFSIKEFENYNKEYCFVIKKNIKYEFPQNYILRNIKLSG